MADISKIKLENTSYNIKDETARTDISSLDTRVTALENAVYVDVVAKGINNSGNDVTEALQELINSYNEGTTFYFQNGTYYCKDILLKNNTKILGNTNTKFIIPTNEEIKNIFKLENVSNIEFENLYLQNASNSNIHQLYGGSFDNFKACILLNNANNITIKNCKFNNFFYGLHCIDSNNINVFDSDFSNSGYSISCVAKETIDIVENITVTPVNFNSYENTRTIDRAGEVFIEDKTW